MLSKLTFGEHATENARKFMRDGAHPSVHDIAFVDAATVVTAGMDGKCRVWDARTGREWEFTHVAGMWDADGTPINGFARAAGQALRVEPRVTIADEAFTWADSGRANCILFRLVDSGHVDIASYALKFLAS